LQAAVANVAQLGQVQQEMYRLMGAPPPPPMGLPPGAVTPGMFDPNLFAFEPGTIVPGIGFGAVDLPRHPGLEAFRRVEELQQLHRQEQEDYVKALDEELEISREEVFAEYHYRIGQNGEVVRGENGLPILERGAESPAQRLARLRWEHDIKEQRSREYRERREAFARDAGERMRVLEENLRLNPSPANFEAYARAVQELGEQEQAMQVEHERGQRRDLVAGLPDPRRPGRRLSERLEQGIRGLSNLQEAQRQRLLATPEGAAVDQYLRELAAFKERQEQLLRQHRQEEGGDPDLMRRLARQQFGLFA
jgi:hypothetical protein